MPDPVKRPYRSARRAETAKQTRQQIRDAAADLFVRQGISATTMRQVAVAAGVAERTVYTVFPTKAALFNEVIDIATVGDELPVPVADRPEFHTTQTETEAGAAARQFAAHGSALLERAGDLINAAIESSGADPDMREFCVRGATAMTANMRSVADAWERAGLLRTGLDAEGAAAILYALGSPHLHHLLRRDQGWDVTRYRDWLVDTLTSTVLAKELLTE